MQCRVTYSSNNHIDVVILENNQPAWRLSCFYGMPERERKQDSWDLLRQLATKDSIPWCAFGDFNDLLCAADKKGEHPHPQHLFDGFRTAIDDCNMVELDLMGGEYTWEKMSRKQFRFCFENSWLQEPSFKGEVATLWNSIAPMNIIPKLLSLSSMLAKWGNKFFHKFRDKVKSQKEVLNSLVDREDEVGVKMYFEERDKLNELLLHEEMYWKQRAKIFWLKDGDANTKFFHAQATKRKKLNHIAYLVTDSGDKVDDHERMYSIELPVITELQNKELTAELSFEEFTVALKQMHPEKAAGPDGYSPAFFQHLWGLVGKDVFDCCKKWLDDNVFPADFTSSNLVLIPKKDNVEKLTDVRPITLCNVVYKILAKVLENRLKCILSDIISENQSAFVPGRSITDNVLIAFEMIHFMKRKKGSQDGEVALKLDISKAYDRVNWHYLWHRLRIMGFSEEWVRWIKLCVTTVHYTAVSNGDINGCRIYVNAPAVSHLLFADDSFLFFKAKVEEAGAVRRLLQEYELQSGQAVNFNKSGIFFSSNVRRDKQHELSSILGVQNELKDSKYLGLPSLIGRSKKKVFSFVKERVWKRVQGWSNSKLSRAGKAVMIKNVAQSIPSYCMSCFLIPKSLTQEIERILNGYWWKTGVNNNKGLRWVSWDKMCSSKSRGGLGFRSLHGFNIALLGKHIWQFLTKPESLVARIFRARYYPDNHVLQASRGQDASFIWQGICEAKEELTAGFKWVLGDGNNINIFSDKWLRGKLDYRVENHHVNSARGDKVKEYFRSNTKQWDVTKVQQTFHELDADCILKTRIPQNQVNDRIAWMHTVDGFYTAKFRYHFWYERHSDRGIEVESNGWKRLWKLQVPHKMKYFLWRLCKNNIPVKNSLIKRGVPTSIICPLCNVDIEHARHVFLECEYARGCWDYSGCDLDISEVEDLSVWLLEKLGMEAETKLVQMTKVLWGIWFARNRRVWEEKLLSPMITMDISMKMVTEWRAAQNKVQGSVQASVISVAKEQVRWQYPFAGWYKMNVDAALREGVTGFKVGMVLRNDKGDFIASMQKCFAEEVSVLEAEAIGVLEALIWITERGDKQVIVESDSLITVNALLNNTIFMAEVGTTFELCRSILSHRSDVRIQHVRRKANRKCTYGRFIDGVPFYTGSCICGSPRKKDSHMRALGRNFRKIDDGRFYLLAKGMLEDYTMWTSHGEKIGRKRSRTSHHRYCVREPSRVEEPVDLNVMLHDLAGENYQFYETTDTGTMNVEEAPNDSAKKLYEVIVENGAPIYPGNTKYARLSFTTKLLEFKNNSHCSNKAFDSLLKLLTDVLPKKHTLPESYYAMKKIMKDLRVEYEKIDSCENDCMLFHGDDKDKVVCDICGEDRYRDVSRKDGKK
ncbi:hypothetical protein AgCh_035786 [Apium graveolens]